MGEIDYDSYVPPYRQIAAEIISDIETGTLRPGRAIPSEATLIQRYGVARDTVRRAVRYLREEGYVFTIPHRGTYVALDRDDSEPNDQAEGHE